MKILDPTMPATVDMLIFNYPCCPPESFFNIKEFYANINLNWLDDKDFKITIPLRNWAATLREWSVLDYHKYYSNPSVKPYFNAYGRVYDEVYYGVDRSVEIAEELLSYQFDNNDELITEFLQTLYNVLDKKFEVEFFVYRVTAFCGKKLCFRRRRMLFFIVWKVRHGE